MLRHCDGLHVCGCVVRSPVEECVLVGCVVSFASCAVAVAVCWSGFAVHVSGSGYGYDVVEGEGAFVEVWEFHVDWLTT